MVECPFCGMTSSRPNVIDLHIEDRHSEASMSSAQDATHSEFSSANYAEPQSTPARQWTKCPRPGCGEYVLPAEMDEHLDLHAALMASEYEASRMEGEKRTSSRHESTSTSVASRSRSPTKLHKAKEQTVRDSRPSRRTPGLLEYFSGSSVHGRPRPANLQQKHHPAKICQLGKRELGPHAFEKAMPASVRYRLLNDALPYTVNRLGIDGKLVQRTIVDNETSGLIPTLADLSALDKRIEATYLCNPSVRHVRRIYCEGNFCGYWSIQMILTYLQNTGSLPNMNQLPDVLEMQDTIEDAWDNGICPYSRVETGGIRGTRKWIGTAEAVAYFTQLGIPTQAMVFSDDGVDLAATQLLDYVEAYYISGGETAKHHGTSHTTRLAPIYFQREGHSMAIVGLERRKDDYRNLLVFDSSFPTSSGIKRFLAGRNVWASPETLMRAYRREDTSLSRWDEFEILVPQVQSD